MWIFGYGSLVWKADFPYIKKVVGYVKGYERKFWQASIDHRGVPGKPGRVVTLVPSSDPENRVYGIAYKIHRKDVDFVVNHLDMREVMGYEKVPAEFHPISHHPLNIFDDHSNIICSNPSPFSSSYNEQGSNVENSTESEEGSLILGGQDTTIMIRNYGNDSDSGRGSDQGKDSDSDSSSITSDDEDYDSNYENVRFGRPFQVIMYFGSDTNEHFVGPASMSSMALQIFECSGKSGRNRDYLFNLAASMREIHTDALDLHLQDLESAVRKLEVAETRRSTNLMKML